MKRRADQVNSLETLEEIRGPKRLKFAKGPDQLSRLSDELLLRVFSNLRVDTLLLCQRVSRKFQSIAVDSELWKGLYYDRFIKPRRQHFTRRGTRTSIPSKSTKLPKWLDEQDLLSKGTVTGWKQQYKLRHNWSRGSCDSSEINVASARHALPFLAKLHHDVVYTVDTTAGLRAWSFKGEQRLLASLSLIPDASDIDPVQPTTFTVDTSTFSNQISRLSVGFQDGSFRLYSFSAAENMLKAMYEHPASSNGALSALAFAWPYLLTITDANLLSLYQFENAPLLVNSAPLQRGYLSTLLASLRSHSIWPPLSLALKIHGTDIVATIAYTFPTFTAGWSAGIQEIRLDGKGEVIRSRIASAMDSGFVSLAKSCPGVRRLSNPIRCSSSLSKPTSLSYSHPYLLVSHSDNTLTVYVVTANSSSLSISSGRKLWGHTSSVFGAHIGKRGKAVSVSARGNEIRIWELEGGILRSDEGRSDFGIPITPDKRSTETTTTDSTLDDSTIAITGDWSFEELTLTRAWVGFDDESVVVLREHKKGNKALTVYDFT